MTSAAAAPVPGYIMFTYTMYGDIMSGYTDACYFVPGSDNYGAVMKHKEHPAGPHDAGLLQDPRLHVPQHPGVCLHLRRAARHRPARQRLLQGRPQQRRRHEEGQGGQGRHAELLATGLRSVCFKAVRSNGVVVKKDKGDEFSSGKKLAYTNGYGYSPARPLMTAPPRVTPTGPGRP